MAKNIIQNHNIANFKTERYLNNIWLMFIAADILHGAAIDLQSQLKGLGDYKFEDKKNVDALESYAYKVISSVGKTCSANFNDAFGDASDEAKTLLKAYIVNNRKNVLNKLNFNNVTE